MLFSDAMWRYRINVTTRSEEDMEPLVRMMPLILKTSSLDYGEIPWYGKTSAGYAAWYALGLLMCQQLVCSCGFPLENIRHQQRSSLFKGLLVGWRPDVLQSSIAKIRTNKLQMRRWGNEVRNKRPLKPKALFSIGNIDMIAQQLIRRYYTQFFVGMSRPEP